MSSRSIVLDPRSGGVSYHSLAADVRCGPAGGRSHPGRFTHKLLQFKTLLGFLSLFLCTTGVNADRGVVVKSGPHYLCIHLCSHWNNSRILRAR